jgi:hypothetical protein
LPATVALRAIAGSPNKHVLTIATGKSRIACRALRIIA